MLRAYGRRVPMVLGLMLCGLSAATASAVPLNLLLGDESNPPAVNLVSDDGSVTFSNFDFVPTRHDGPDPEDIDVSPSPAYPGGFIISAPLDTFRGRPSIIMLSYDAAATENGALFILGESELLGPVFDATARAGPPTEPFMASSGVYDQFLPFGSVDPLQAELFVFTHRRWNRLDDCGDCDENTNEPSRLFDTTDLLRFGVSEMRVFVGAGVQIVPGVLGGDEYLLQFSQNFVVPEPGTLSIGLFGFGALMTRRRRNA